MPKPCGLILAGGLGTRMGGVTKADVRLGGTRLLRLCEERLEPQVDGLAVNTNDPLETALPQLPDTMEGHLGPLAGILAGLDWAETRGHTHMVSVAVDTPFFPCDLVPYLQMAAEAHPLGLAIAATSEGEHGTFGSWPVALIPALTTFLQGGGRKVRAFTSLQNAALARFPDTTPPAFFNINTPDDLAQAEGWL